MYKDANGRPLKPLKNEIVSRDQMQKTPPHILVTNYAMLEYMMLRPKDDLVFSRAKLRFLVLDEAHIYRGATGMETSLLLKRLKARISNPANVLHILTSATLGGKEADDDIVKFAETLCNASFYAEDIIRSQSVVPSYDREPVDVPLSMFAELIDPQKPLNVIADDYGLPIPDGIPDAEYLYDLCVSASVYRDLRRITSHPMTIPEITRALRATHNVTQQDVVNIIGVAAQASKNKSALIKARYHMFAKALEGAYVTLGQNKKLMLNRNRSITIGDENWKVFECAICDDCGRVAVAGKEVDGKLEFANSSYDPEIEYYLLRDSRDIDLDLDEEDEDDTEEIGKNDYILCSKCGALIHESLKADPPCTCGLTHYVKLRKARKSGSRGDGKCPSCNFGTFKTFYLGYDAATAVLGTSLFEELPESEKVLKSKKSAQPVKKSLFGAAKQGAQVDIVRRKRQFLSFSDSRGEAAFFASYMTAAYSEFLRRRGIWHVVEKNKENMAAHPWEIQHFVDELTSYFDSCRTFAEPGDKGVENLTATSRKNAWIAVLNDIFAVALSDFFAKQVDVYNSNNADVLLSGDGWERFCAYLSSKPEHLKDVLKASIPESMHRVMGINDFSWTEKLVGKDGVLKVAVDEFRGTVQYYIDEYRRLLAEGLTQQAAAVEKKLWSYRRGKEDNRGRNELIEFLVRNNVLPKYGFPVDTVELYQNTNAATDKKLQMVRDLQLAISEYAPDSQVVADGKLYTSRYIRKLPQTTGQDWETAYIAQCNNPSCMTWNHRLMEPDEGGEPCVSCHEIISKSRWKQAIEPRKGFVADAKPKDVPMRKPDKAFRSDDFYIGDAQRQVMQKYAFVMKDGNRFQMETSINDSLMVVCNDDFYVCPHCGYAESTMENMEVAGFNSHQKTLEKKHITPWGKNCEVKLVKNKLCHVFKTDVVRLVFSTPQAGNQEVMLSVMYALLEALSSVMDIERNDIKGCLHKIVYDNKLIYAIVLYDAVAGGAGHVRRLVTEDGRCFRQVVEKAIAITKGCNCSPSCYSCLRNYYNQKIHDLLNRKYAYDFLENYYGELEPITNV